MGVKTGKWDCRKCGINFNSLQKYNRHWYTYHAAKGPQIPIPKKWQHSDSENSGELSAASSEIPETGNGIQEPRETVMSIFLELLDEQEISTEIRLKYSVRILRLIDHE